MKIIINRGKEFSTINEIIKPTYECMTIILKAIKEKKATLLLDNDNTLMYLIKN